MTGQSLHRTGIIGLTLSAAATYARRGIRVNCVAPGLTATPLTEAITSNAASREVSLAMNPMQRLGEPDDIASAVAWLLDPAQRWLTGQVIGVDGRRRRDHVAEPRAVERLPAAVADLMAQLTTLVGDRDEG